MKLRLECPVDFLSTEELGELLSHLGYEINDTDPNIVVVNPGTKKFLDYSHFSSYKNLKIVATPSTGTNHIDVNSLKEKNVSVVCLLDDREALDNIHASAEFTWLHIMNLMRKFSKAINCVDEWRSENNEYYLRSNELHSKSIGIIGLGRIGKKIANYANCFGMNVSFYDPYKNEYPDFIKKASNIQQLSSCDIISINCYLTPETNKLITYGTLDDVKPGTVVVNTSRGEIIDEEYVVNLIEKNKILFAADVLQNEQNLLQLKESKLYKISKSNSNVVITPHVAGATIESQLKALKSVLSLSKGFFT